jgi:hypothetical protein
MCLRRLKKSYDPVTYIPESFRTHDVMFRMPKLFVGGEEDMDKVLRTLLSSEDFR